MREGLRLFLACARAWDRAPACPACRRIANAAIVRYPFSVMNQRQLFPYNGDKCNYCPPAAFVILKSF